METFYGNPADAASASCGVTFSWVTREDGKCEGVVPAVGVRFGNRPLSTVIALTDSDLVRSLIEDLTAGLTYLENAK